MRKGSDQLRLFPWPDQKTTNSSIDLFWLVVSNMAFIFHNIWDNPSHWRSYFSRWLKPPTSLCFWGSLLFIERFETRKDVPLSLKESLVFGVRIAAAFKHFDKDGSGVLEHQEISSAQGIIFRAGLANIWEWVQTYDRLSVFFFTAKYPWWYHGGTTMLWPERSPSVRSSNSFVPTWDGPRRSPTVPWKGWGTDHGAIAPWWTQWTQLPSLPGILEIPELSCWGIDVNKDGTVSLLQWNHVFLLVFKADQV